MEAPHSDNNVLATANATYQSLEELVSALQKDVSTHGFVVVKARTKKNPRTGDVEVCYFRCDRGGKVKKPSGQRRKHTTTRLMDCLWSGYARYKPEELGWRFILRNGSHNHLLTASAIAHPSLRLAHLTAEVKDQIAWRSQAQIPPGQILTSLRLADPNLPLSIQDIYNTKAAIRREARGPLTPIQAIMQELNLDDWKFSYEKNINNQITRLFICREECWNIFKTNHDILVIDVTYKTNRFRLPLLIMTGITNLNISFFVCFAFLLNETVEDFQ